VLPCSPDGRLSIHYRALARQSFEHGDTERTDEVKATVGYEVAFTFSASTAGDDGGKKFIKRHRTEFNPPAIHEEQPCTSPTAMLANATYPNQATSDRSNIRIEIRNAFLVVANSSRDWPTTMSMSVRAGHSREESKQPIPLSP
jgi:hypothetical protein